MIKTSDVIDAALASDGKTFPFKRVEGVFKSGLALKLDRVLDTISSRTYSFTYLDWEVRVSHSAGRTLMMFIAPDKDWISFLVDRGGDGTRAGLQGVHFEDAPQSKFYDFAVMLTHLDGFEELAVEEPTMSIG